MEIRELKTKDLNPEAFITEKVDEISSIVGEGKVVNTLSGGVDSSTVTMLGDRALGDNLKTYFINSGLMRENEPQEVASLFKKLGVEVEIVNAQEKFFAALKGITDPEEKREAVRQTFYRDVFGKLVKETGAKCILQGTIFTDIEETVAGIKRQHNIFKQLGIDPEKAFGYKIIEPLQELRKDGVRKIAKALGLPKSVYDKMPFPGPGLATRVLGEVTPKKIETVRKATTITEKVLALNTNAFQYLAILHQDRVTGIREGKRELGLQIEIRCWESLDATTAKPTNVNFSTLEHLADRITSEVPGVVSVTYNITSKPTSTIEPI